MLGVGCSMLDVRLLRQPIGFQGFIGLLEFIKLKEKDIGAK
jgi:hypothetical protein